MRILIFSNNYCGLYSFRKEVINAILNDGHKVVISAPFDDNTSYFKNIGCSIINTPFDRKGKNPLKDIALLFRYILLIKKVKPDILLTYTIKPNLYGGLASQLWHIPQMANITGLGSAVENSGWLQDLTTWLYRIGLRKTSLVFFQNRDNMAFCIRNRMVKGRRILLPGSGVNLQYHSYKAYPPSNEPIRFVFIGRLIYEKGIEDYLDAAVRIKSVYPNTEFHILGGCEDDYFDRLKKLQENGVIFYHGLQNDVRPFLAKSHCTIHPSFYPEGMSNVLLESCAAGRPIITTDRPGCHEIVDDGVNGYVVKAKDVKGLVDTIERFIMLPYRQKILMGQEARRKVECEFDRNIVIKAYLNEIRKIVNPGFSTKRP